jgi:hypothetical protein
LRRLLMFPTRLFLTLMRFAISTSTPEGSY